IERRTVNVALPVPYLEKATSGAVRVSHSAEVGSPRVPADPRLVGIGIADDQDSVAAANVACHMFIHSAAVVVEIFIDCERTNEWSGVGQVVLPIIKRSDRSVASIRRYAITLRFPVGLRPGMRDPLIRIAGSAYGRIIKTLHIGQCRLRNYASGLDLFQRVN